MLTIRDAQLVAFLRPFVEWTLRYLREAEADRVAPLDDDTLRSVVELACRVGLRHGVREPRLLLRLVLLLLEAGPALADDPEAHAILSRSGQGPETRLDELSARTGLLARIRSVSGTSAWTG